MVERLHPYPEAESERRLVAELAAYMARLLYNGATLDDCTKEEKSAWLGAAQELTTAYDVRPRGVAQTLTVRGTAENRKKIAKVIFLRSFNEWDWDDPDFALRRRDAERTADAIVTALAVPSTARATLPEPRIAERLADVVMMLDAPDAYNREYIAAVCRSILSSVSSTDKSGAA